MPELPEVETIKRELLEKVKGKRVSGVRVEKEKSVKLVSPGEFEKILVGKVFSDIQRRGKYLIIYLDSESTLIVHLRVTGRLLFSKDGQKIPKYTKIIFTFDDGSQLFFSDMRGFGTAYLVAGTDFGLIPGLAQIGPEPLESNFSPEVLANLLRKKRGKIKPILMDQSFIAGVGNIYAQETLFRAGIHPERDVSTLSKEEIKAIYESLTTILRQAIAHRGTSTDTYVDLNGKKGSFEAQLQVYGKEDQTCMKCGNPIRKKKIAGRGTCFCPKCQK